MRTELVAVDRRAARRGAARAWQRSGTIDEATRSAIEQRYADDWRCSGWIFRLLLGLFTVIAIAGFLGFWLAALGHPSEATIGITVLVAGLALTFATELLQSRVRLRRFGVEEACALLAVAGSLGGALFLWATLGTPSDEDLMVVGLALAVPAAALAAWRWGMPLFGAAAAVALLGLLARFPGARWSWLVVALLLHRPLLAASAAAARPRALRAACAWAWGGLAVGLFAAAFVPSWDRAWIERLGGRPTDALPDLPWLRFALALVMVGWPAWLLIAGARQRRPLLLRVGALLALVALAELVDEIALVPVWLRILLGGVALLGAGLGLRRWLARGADGERRGITGEPPLAVSNATQLVETVAALATLTPAARQIAAEPAGFTGQGGEFGGGGASGKF